MYMDAPGTLNIIIVMFTQNILYIHHNMAFGMYTTDKGKRLE